MNLKAKIQILLAGGVWSVLSAVSFVHWKAPVQGWVFAVLGSLMLVAGLFVPPLARGIHRVVTALTRALVLAMSALVLGGIYYALITPLGLILRMTGSLRTTRGAGVPLDTYWTPRPKEPLSPAQYLRPF